MGKKGRAQEEAMLADMNGGTEATADIFDGEVLPLEGEEMVAAAEIANPSAEPAIEEVLLHWEDLEPLTEEEIQNLRKNIGSQIFYPGEVFKQENGFTLTIDEMRQTESYEVYYEISITSPFQRSKSITCQTQDQILAYLEKHEYEREQEETIVPPTEEATPSLAEHPITQTVVEEEKVLDRTPKKTKEGTLDSLAALDGLLSEEDRVALTTPEEATVTPTEVVHTPAASLEPVETTAPKAETLDEVLALHQVYNYINEKGTKKYLTITSIRKGEIFYKEYNTSKGDWGKSIHFPKRKIEEAIKNGKLRLETLTAETTAIRANRDMILGFRKQKSIFVDRESRQGSREEQDPDTQMRVDGYDEASQVVSLTSLSGKKYITMSIYQLRADYRLLPKKKGVPKVTTVEPETLPQAKEDEKPVAEAPAPPVPVADESPQETAPKAESEVTTNADVSTEAGREQVAKELQALVEKMKEAKYYSVLGESVMMVNTNGPSKLTREQFTMLGNADTQALYEKMKQKIAEDFAVNVFTTYQDNALRIWGVQRFTENQKTKFLTHIFEIKDFFDLPAQDLPGALQSLQKNLTLADTQDWQEIFCSAIEALGDKNAPEWMAKVDTAESAKAKSEE
jgi:hypothetical protein